MKPYSLDLRLKVLDAVDCGIPKEELVGIFGVSMSTIDRYLRQRRQTGEIAPGRTPRRTPLICATIEERRSLWRQLEENGSLGASERGEENRGAWPERMSLHELVSRSLKVLGRGNADFRELR